jgi:hypothetical protein
MSMRDAAREDWRFLLFLRRSRGVSAEPTDRFGATPSFLVLHSNSPSLHRCCIVMTNGVNEPN